MRFEDLEIWKNGMRLCVEIYNVFKNCKDFGFKDQIQRASVSIPSNIAEGFERKSKKEYMHFLYIAKGSCGEVRTQLYLAISIGLIDKSIGDELLKKSSNLSGMMGNFIKSHFNSIE